MQKLLCLINLFLPSLVLAQTPTQQSVKANIEQYASAYPKERIYLHLDKPAYAPGETIWYKAYLMADVDRSAFSTNLYVDLTDAEGNVLTHEVTPVEESSAKGNFNIPERYSAKSIHIRAYTKWMLNFDSAFLYDKDIRIIQTKRSAVKASPTTDKPVVQFFPEGGDCIMGINNKVAFKAIYPNGKPCKISGVVVNAKGESVAEIESIHDGMGFFYLEPRHVETFMAQWKDEQAVSYQTALPSIKETGVALEVKFNKGQPRFLIKRSQNPPLNFLQVHIVATLHQQLIYMASVKLDASTITGGVIPVSELTSGILQVTLFDADWVAIAERVTFLNNEDYSFEPKVDFSTVGTGKRETNTLVINVPDSIESNLSVAVTDAGIGVDSSDNIISRLMLTGDLRGTVYHPSYYFTNNSDSLQEQLDLVMLTNGWRRIKWDDVVKGKMPDFKYQNDTSYFSLSGKIVGASEKKLRESALLLLFLQHREDTTGETVQTFLKPDGTFSEPDIILFDTTKIYYTLPANKNLSHSAKAIFNGLLPSPRKIVFDDKPALYFSDSATENRNRYFAEEQARLAKLLQGTILKGVTVKAKIKSPAQLLDENYTSLRFRGGNAINFNVLNDPGGWASPNVFTYLQGRVAGLRIIPGFGPGDTAFVSWRGMVPKFYLDEIQVDVGELSDMSMTNVAYIKLFRRPSLVDGIAIYTNKGGYANYGFQKSVPFETVIGYTSEKEFYSPDYDILDQRNDNADLRSTLYWNPMLLTTNENHTLKLSFYNNDISRSFRVIVEGVSKNGRLTHIEKVIE